MTITTSMYITGILSVYVLLLTVVIAGGRSVPFLGRRYYQYFNPMTLAVGVALAALVFDFGQHQALGDMG